MITRILIAAVLVLSCGCNGNKVITVEEATKWVAERRGNFDVTSIDKDVAHEFAKYTGQLFFTRLKSIDKDSALELAESDSIALHFPALTSIDKNVAHEFAKYDAGLSTLLLNGLKSLDKDVAHELGSGRLLSLQLNGLTSIDREVARELAGSKIYLLTLGGITSLDKNVAQELTKFKGYLELNGLTLIDKDVLPILKSNPKIELPQKYRD